MFDWRQTILTVLCSIIASSGFWAYILKRNEGKDSRSKMLVGLGHDRIVYLGTKFIERGYITHDELENLYDYLYEPYKNLGGNGTAERVMNEVLKLPIKRSVYDFSFHSKEAKFEVQYEKTKENYQAVDHSCSGEGCQDNCPNRIRDDIRGGYDNRF